VLLVVCRKNRPSEDLPTPTAEAAVAAASSCSSTAADRSIDIETQNIVPQTSVELERLCSSSCTPASYDEPIELYALEEAQPLTDDADDDDVDAAASAIWIETTKTPSPSSPSSIVWRSREFNDAADRDQPRRTSEVTVSSRSRWLTRSPAIELCQPEPQQLESVELSTSGGDIAGRRVSGARLPNGIIPGTRSSSSSTPRTRSSSPPPYQSVWTQLQPATLTRPRSESNFAAVVTAPVAQRSNAAVERLRSLPPTRSTTAGDDVTPAQRRRRRTVDLAPASSSSPYIVSADDVNRSKLGRVSKEELHRMWKASERSLHAQLRVAMQQKAELQQRLRAAGLASAERLTVT